MARISKKAVPNAGCETLPKQLTRRGICTSDFSTVAPEGLQITLEAVCAAKQ
jgi:hypothetical protein